MIRRLVLLLLIVFAAASAASAQGPPSEPLAAELRAIVQSDARAYRVDAAGMSRTGRRLWSAEPLGSPDPARGRLVIVGGIDGSADGATAVVDILRWFMTDPAAASLRTGWQVAALPCVYVERCGGGVTPPMTAVIPDPTFPPEGGYFGDQQDPESRVLWRWIAMQAPDLVIDVRLGGEPVWTANTGGAMLQSMARPAAASSLAQALGAERAAGLGAVPTLQLDASPGEMARVLRVFLSTQPGVSRSALRAAMDTRLARAPLAIARLMTRYPAQPSMSYIPALSWSGALRLAGLTGEAAYRDKPLADLAPFVSGQQAAIAEPFLLTSLAGHLALADLGALEGSTEAAALARKAADVILPKAPGDVVRFPRAWTDDMFMATSVWARMAAQTKDARYSAAAAQLLTTYATRLQRPDGLFVHAADAPYAWGRGNGFAAFGLMEALTFLGEAWPERGRVLDSYRGLMNALLAHQAPDGMWRQVVDEPGSYREFTVTAMVITAMARGVRLGWIGANYRSTVDRAWRGLLARIAEDGTLIDVCTGTGSGPTKQYYLDRAATSGADDRGGAMAITAALEMAALAR